MFRAAAPNLPYPVEQVQIPWQGIHLEGYIIRPTIRLPAGSGSGSSPTLLMPSGYDSPVEESYLAGRRRGGGQGDSGDPAFNDVIWKAYPGIAGQEYRLSRIHALGLSTPLECAQEMRKHVADVDAISCPAFVSYGEGDFAEATTSEFYRRLSTANKRFVTVTPTVAAGIARAWDRLATTPTSSDGCGRSGPDGEIVDHTDASS